MDENSSVVKADSSSDCRQRSKAESCHVRSGWRTAHGADPEDPLVRPARQQAAGACHAAAQLQCGTTDKPLHEACAQHTQLTTDRR